MVKAAFLKVGDRGSSPALSFRFQITLKDSVLLEASVTKGSVLRLRPPGLEFRILCMKGSGI